MRVGEGTLQVRVHMVGERLEGLVIAVEAVDVNDEQSTPAVGI